MKRTSSRKPKRRLIGIPFLCIALIAALSGCGKVNASTSSSSSKTGAKTIKIAVVTQYKPYGYLDDKGQIAGYEIDVLRAINAKLPQYDFSYSPAGTTTLTDLETGKIDVAASQWYKTPDRENKYEIPTEGYTYYGTYIVWSTSAHPKGAFQTLDDLVGKTVIGYQSSAEISPVEAYNKTHNPPITIKYTQDADPTTLIKALQNGTADAEINQDYNVNAWNKEFNANLVTSDKPVFTGQTYQLIHKGDVQLAQDFSTAIKEIKNDGTLSSISVKDLGADYSKAPGN